MHQTDLQEYRNLSWGTVALLLGALITRQIVNAAAETHAECEPGRANTHFLVMAGGGAPSYNEIALEKNVLYFQRTLQALEFDLDAACFYFANGNDSEATVRYLDDNSQEQFKVPEISGLHGPSTANNLDNWLQASATIKSPHRNFLYFTGHGTRNYGDLDNNNFVLWNENQLSVQEFSTMLDGMPRAMPITVMMSQCYAGSFANIIYEGGDPSRPLASQERCGFFATIESQPSVGCTPEIDEADYQDYSSSFFAGLSGIDRTGREVASADFDGNGTVSYAEAHAFVKVDGQTTDLPVSTAEVWLQEQETKLDEKTILGQPIYKLLSNAPAQRVYVVDTLATQFGFDLHDSFDENVLHMKRSSVSDEEIENTYLTRLRMELMTIGIQERVSREGSATNLSTLDTLNSCEASSWERE